MNWKKFKAENNAQAEALAEQLGYDPEALHDSDADALLKSCIAIAREENCALEDVKQSVLNTSAQQAHEYNCSDLMDSLNEASDREAKRRRIDRRLTAAYIKRQWVKELRIKRQQENDEYFDRLKERFPAVDGDYYATEPMRSLIDGCCCLDKLKADVEAVDSLELDVQHKGELIAWLLKNKTSRDWEEERFSYSDEDFTKLFADYEALGRFDFKEEDIDYFRDARLKFEVGEKEKAEQWLDLVLLRHMSRSIDKTPENGGSEDDPEYSNLLLKRTIDAYSDLIDRGFFTTVMNAPANEANIYALQLMKVSYAGFDLSRHLKAQLNP